MADRDILQARLSRVQIGPLRDIAKGLDLEPSRDTKANLVSKIVNELLTDRRETEE